MGCGKLLCLECKHFISPDYTIIREMVYDCEGIFNLQKPLLNHLGRNKYKLIVESIALAHIKFSQEITWQRLEGKFLKIIFDQKLKILLKQL